jgi:hypothetical protein
MLSRPPRAVTMPMCMYIAALYWILQSSLVGAVAQGRRASTGWLSGPLFLRRSDRTHADARALSRPSGNFCGSFN